MVYGDRRAFTGWPERQLRRFGTLLIVLALAMVVFSSQAGAGTEFDIIDVLGGTTVGSITFPSASGSSPGGVELNIDGFTAADITSINWELAPGTLDVVSLALKARRGDFPCPPAPPGGCSNDELTLTSSQAQIAHRECPASPPGGTSTCSVSLGFRLIAFQAAVPTHACVGFGPPLDNGAVHVRKNRALPFKALLIDASGVELTDALLLSPPVIQVQYASAAGEAPVDVTGDALSAGKGTEGNQFVYSGSHWQFNLKINNYGAPGTYSAMLLSGDSASYRVEPTCTAQFVVK